jgi:hypothetical protein
VGRAHHLQNRRDDRRSLAARYSVNIDVWSKIGPETREPGRYHSAAGKDGNAKACFEQQDEIVHQIFFVAVILVEDVRAQDTHVSETGGPCDRLMHLHLALDAFPELPRSESGQSHGIADCDPVKRPTENVGGCC